MGFEIETLSFIIQLLHYLQRTAKATGRHISSCPQSDVGILRRSDFLTQVGGRKYSGRGAEFSVPRSSSWTARTLCWLSLFAEAFDRDRESTPWPDKRVSFVRCGKDERASVYCLKVNCKSDERESVTRNNNARD